MDGALRAQLPSVFSWSHFGVCSYWEKLQRRGEWGLLNPLLTDHFVLAGRAVQTTSGLRGEQVSLHKRKRALKKANLESGKINGMRNKPLKHPSQELRLGICCSFSSPSRFLLLWAGSDRLGAACQPGDNPPVPPVYPCKAGAGWSPASLAGCLGSWSITLHRWLHPNTLGRHAPATSALQGPGGGKVPQIHQFY